MEKCAILSFPLECIVAGGDQPLWIPMATIAMARLSLSSGERLQWRCDENRLGV